MAQIYTTTVTCAAAPANIDINLGFDAAHVEIRNRTGANSVANPGVVKKADWYDTMAADSAYIVKNTNGAATDQSTIIAANGISMIHDNATYGSSITAFTNANPGVITVSDAAGAGFAVGDTINVVELADNGAGASLNGTYVIAVIAGNALTTATNTAAFSVRVSGGNAYRVKDVNNVPIPIRNRAQLKVRLGTGVQDANSEFDVIIYGKNCVV